MIPDDKATSLFEVRLEPGTLNFTGRMRAMAAAAHIYTQMGAFNDTPKSIMNTYLVSNPDSEYVGWDTQAHPYATGPVFATVKSAMRFGNLLRLWLDMHPGSGARVTIEILAADEKSKPTVNVQRENSTTRLAIERIAVALELQVEEIDSRGAACHPTPYEVYRLLIFVRDSATKLIQLLHEERVNP